MANTIKLTQTILVIILWSVGLVSCTVLGQAIEKKQLTEADYDLWGSLHTYGISDNGQWVNYKVSYPDGNDTLFVKSIKSPIIYAMPKVQIGNFLGNNRFAFLSKGKLEIITLESGIRNYIDNVQDCQSFNKGQYILATKLENGSTSLNLYRHDGRLANKIDNVTGYAVNNGKDALMYSKTENELHSIGITDFSTTSNKQMIISKSTTPFSKLVWSKDDKAVAFQALPPDSNLNSGMLYFYNIGTKRLHSISDIDKKTFPKGQRLSSDNALPLRISDDHSRVFFGAENMVVDEPVRDDDLVEIWKHNDTVLYPIQTQVRHSPRAESHLVAWNVNQDNVVTIGKGQYRWALTAGNGRYVISSGKATDFRDLRYYQNTKYFITDVTTAKTSVLLASHPGTTSTFSMSPDGRYFAYIKDANWWTYDTSTGQHQNITNMLSSQWDTSISNPGYSVFSFGVSGWDQNGNLIINDEYDVWSVMPTGKGGKRLTQGREAQMQFRLATDVTSRYKTLSYSTASCRVIDFKKALILTTYNAKNGVSGYARLDKGKIIPVSSPLYKADRLFVSDDPNTILYEEQGYELPPRIVTYDCRHKTQKIVAQSNTHHSQYNWGHSEVISYKVGMDSLRGFLIYPANYKKGMKYPMVTYIYERLLHKSQEYVNPTKYNVMGVNFTNLSAKGYFVLLPDIRYRPGFPGESALECVSAAVNKVLEMGIVDSYGIGITGHSFGGYETNYIIAHSKLFSAAISGAGVSEIIYSYLSYGEVNAEIDYWRYEDQQFRINKSFFEDTDLYIKNSPIFSAANITTPLLTWAGKNDQVVSPDQSFLMYATMRRLKKKNILLFYPDDLHSLAKKENQKDITMRVENWFDHYLKGIKADWID